ncbi:hypothetical protein HDU93_008185, partial [Gonapodya sp. JEL0774]
MAEMFYRQADGLEIFRKTPEAVKKYYQKSDLSSVGRRNIKRDNDTSTATKMLGALEGNGVSMFPPVLDPLPNATNFYAENDDSSSGASDPESIESGDDGQDIGLTSWKVWVLVHNLLKKTVGVLESAEKFAGWRDKVEVELDAQGLLGILNGKEGRPTEIELQSVWDKKNNVVLAALYATVADELCGVLQKDKS